MLDAHERAEKQKVRERDRRCRFPLCRCHLRRTFCEVSHRFHKGSGGDPTGERSKAELMILLCPARHRTSAWSVDQKTLRWTPLTDAGSDGPVAWAFRDKDGSWVEVAREREGDRRWDVVPAHRLLLETLALAEGR